MSSSTISIINIQIKVHNIRLPAEVECENLQRKELTSTSHQIRTVQRLVAGRVWDSLQSRGDRQDLRIWLAVKLVEVLVHQTKEKHSVYV